ncbi:MAG: hypothetical protein AAGC95_00800 [Pseudomonadota bacterium]
MRKFLIFLAWSGLIGALLDAAITIFAAWEVARTPALGIDITVDEHLLHHLPFLYWLKDVAYLLAPNSWIDWLFGLPALAYFPFRILINLLFGWWMMHLARRLHRRNQA